MHCLGCWTGCIVTRLVIYSENHIVYTTLQLISHVKHMLKMEHVKFDLSDIYAKIHKIAFKLTTSKVLFVTAVFFPVPPVLKIFLVL